MRTKTMRTLPRLFVVIASLRARDSAGVNIPGNLPGDLLSIRDGLTCNQLFGAPAQAACCPDTNPACALPSSCPNAECSMHFRALINNCFRLIESMSTGKTLIRSYQALYASCWTKFPPSSNDTCVSASFKRGIRTVAGGPIDFERCARWGDGCNSCLIERKSLVGCSAKVCSSSRNLHPTCQQLNDPTPVDPLLLQAHAYLEGQPKIDALHNALIKACSYKALETMCETEDKLGAKWGGAETKAKYFCKSKCRAWSYKMVVVCRPGVAHEDFLLHDQPKVVKLLNICKTL